MKKNLKPFLQWLGMLCFMVPSSIAFAQEDASNFTKENLIADFKLAADILKKQHPNPYKFVDSLTLEKQLDSLWNHMETATDAYACLTYSPVQLFKDVHTQFKISTTNSLKGIQGAKYFPFPVIIKQNRIFVNIKGEDIPYLSEIKAINGKSTESIIANLAGSTYSDGYIRTGTDRLFRGFQSLFSWHTSAEEKYSITYSLPGGEKELTKKLEALTPSQGIHRSDLAAYPFNRLQRKTTIFSDFDPVNKLGILSVHSFNIQESQAYREFSAFFNEMKKRGYNKVIVDIRNNGGGNPAISALLYSFLAPQAFDNIYNQRTKTNDIVFKEYLVQRGRKMTDDEVLSTKNFMRQRFDWDSVSGFYVGNTRLRENQIANYPPDKNAFDGAVYVLTSGATVSAATYFASLVQKNKRGLIVGSETGSGEASTTAAWFLNYELPNTKSTLTIPMSEIYFFNATEDNGRGVIPDMEVPLDKFLKYAKDYQDPELNFVIDHIIN